MIWFLWNPSVHWYVSTFNILHSQHSHIPTFWVCLCDLLVTYLHLSHHNSAARVAMTWTGSNSRDISVINSSITSQRNLKKKKEKADRLWESNKDFTATFSPKAIKKLIMQEYNKATSNAKNEQTSKKYWKKPD